MNKLKSYVKSIVAGSKQCTMLGIGPMSSTLIEASLLLSMEKDFPLMYIASRNQVDSDKFGGGYVNNWDAKRFIADINTIALKIGYNGNYFVCRDHGGPWQRDKERQDALSRPIAMKIAKESFYEDIAAGFSLLHIDPTKIPGYSKAPIEDVIDMTVELIEFCEHTKELLGIREIDYEVGTEETNGGLTADNDFEYFIKTLFFELDKKSLPHPIFIVGQTGTLVKMTTNVGKFNVEKAKSLTDITRKYNIGFKEHNCDYIPFYDLALHPCLNVTASNVAPEFGYTETLSLLKLCEIEDNLIQHGFIKYSSNLRNTLLKESIESGRWKKWLINNISKKDIYNNENLSNNILYLAGHYTFNNKEVVESRGILYKNLEMNSVNAQQIVISDLQKSIEKYVLAFNLSSLKI